MILLGLLVVFGVGLWLVLLGLQRSNWKIVMGGVGLEFLALGVAIAL